MFRILLIIIGIIVLYKLIFDFIIPVYRTSRDIRRKFRDINQQMGDRMNQFNRSQSQGQAQAEPQPKKPVTGKDYIDFEEIK
jgi:hypothetical protein